MLRIISAFFACLLPLTVSAVTNITIATGDINGLYYPIGSAICNQINQHQQDLKLHCTAKPTSGTIENLQLLQKGKVQFAMVQSDWQNYAYRGTAQSPFKAPDHALRSVFAIHGEPFTVVVSAKSNINNLTDLKGKRIDIGADGSGAEATMRKIMRRLNWQDSDFKLVKTSPLKEQAELLCAGKIDAFIAMLGHPNHEVRELAATCPIKIINVENPQINLLLKTNPFYVPMLINPDHHNYPGVEKPVKTFGVQATLVTNTDVPNWIVYNVVKTVFNNLETLKRAHPALLDLNPKGMLVGNSAPYAEGALQYYKERGWIFNMAQ